MCSMFLLIRSVGCSKDGSVTSKTRTHSSMDFLVCIEYVRCASWLVLQVSLCKQRPELAATLTDDLERA